jgi:hypothetical protein
MVDLTRDVEGRPQTRLLGLVPDRSARQQSIGRVQRRRCSGSLPNTRAGLTDDGTSLRSRYSRGRDA